MSVATTGSKKIAYYLGNNRIGAPGRSDKSEVWAYINQDGTVDFHLDVYDTQGLYLGHVNFSAKKKDLKMAV